MFAWGKTFLVYSVETVIVGVTVWHLSSPNYTLVTSLCFPNPCRVSLCQIMFLVNTHCVLHYSILLHIHTSWPSLFCSCLLICFFVVLKLACCHKLGFISMMNVFCNQFIDFSVYEIMFLQFLKDCLWYLKDSSKDS